jgi:hypothetical protein
MPVNSQLKFRRHLLAGIDPMGGIVTSYLKSPQGQQAICEFATSPNNRETMKQVLPGILSCMSLPQDLQVEVARRLKEIP